MSFGGKVDCLLDIHNWQGEALSHHWYISGVLWCCSQEVESKCPTKYYGRLAIYQQLISVSCADHYVKAELPQMFQSYESLFALIAPQHDNSQLVAEFLEYQACVLKEIVTPLLFWGYMYWTGPFFHAFGKLQKGCRQASDISGSVPYNVAILSRCALDPLTFPIASTIGERAFSMLRAINRKGQAAVMDSNVAKYARTYYNKLEV